MATHRLPAVLLAALLLSSMAPASALAGAAGAAGAADATGLVRTSVEGTLELEHSDHVDATGRPTSATFRYYVRDEDGRRTQVTFPRELPAGFEPGARVRITGHWIGAGIAADGQQLLADAGSNGTDAADGTAEAATAAAPVTKRLAVILVNFASNPVQPYTPEYATGVIFTNTNSIAAFFAEESYGKLELTGDVSGWFTIQYDTRTCDTAAIQTKADAKATAAGVVLSNYTNVSYVFPHLNACSFAGRALLPGTRTWINTISTTTPKIHDWVVAHELAHNFGVHHANSYRCTKGGLRISLSASAADCFSTEYGDPLSFMGAANPVAKFPHGHAWHRAQMGFIAAAERRFVSKSGLHTLGATNYATSSPKSLRINRTGTGATRHWFDLEFRQPGGLFDGFATTAPVVNGATIRLVADDDVRTQSWLIDTTPATTSFVDAPLGVGQTFTDPLSGIAFTTVGIVTDAAGNPAVKVKVLFPNTAPPVAPTGFTATSSEDGLTATLAWTQPTSEVGVAKYRIYRDDVLVATVSRPATSWTDPDRVPGATYAYRIEAIDWVDLVGPSATSSVLMFIPALGATTASFAGPAGNATAATGGTVTRATTITFGLHFSAPVTRLTPASLALSGSATGCTVTGLSGSGADYSVSVTGCSEGTLATSIGAGTVHDNLGYLAPAVDAVSDTVLIDRTAPVTKWPVAQLREGSRLTGSSMSVVVAIAGTDAGSGITSYDVARSVDGGAYAAFLTGSTTTSFETTLTPGHTYRFRSRARDQAGNVSGWVEGPLLTPGLTEGSSTAITYRGTWSTAYAAEFSGGSTRWARTSTDSATYSVKGRGIALVTTTGPGRGQLKVYIDGVYVRTIDLYRSTTRHRVVAFSHVFPSWGTHTIKLVPVGTAGRPRIDVDAFAVIR